MVTGSPSGGFSSNGGWSTAERRLVFVLVLYLPVIYFSLFRQVSFETVLRMEYPGWDFHFWYDAAQVLISGGDPYSVAGFPAPPMSLLPALSLSPMDFDSARWVFLAANVALCLFAIWFAARANASAPVRAGFLVTVLFFLASNPAQMLLERGNTDGLVLAALSLAIFSRNRIVAGVGLAIGVAVKVYPVVLFAGLLGQRKWRQMIIASVGIAVLAVVVYPLTIAYLPTMLGRSGYATYRENIAPHAITEYFGWPDAFYIFALVYVVSMLFLDMRITRVARDRQTSLVLLSSYTIPMLFAPLVVHWYSGVILILLFIALDAWDASRSRRRRTVLAAIQAVIYMPAWAYVVVTDSDFIHIIPALALVVLAGWMVLWRLQVLRSLPERAPSRTPTTPPAEMAS